MMAIFNATLATLATRIFEKSAKTIYYIIITNYIIGNYIYRKHYIAIPVLSYTEIG